MPRIYTNKQRDILTAVVDLSVRLRVSWTSKRRPDSDKFSDYRGTDKTRCGTGFIYYVPDPVSDKPCPSTECTECNGEKTRKYWRFMVRTAAHVVYNMEEAESTKVDLFYDDDSCRLDGTMATVTVLKVVEVAPDKDVCVMMCLTHDNTLGERIEAANSLWLDRWNEPLDLSALDVLVPPSCDGGRDLILIVSHPHGQPKKITVGRVRDGEYTLIEYNTATCRGSSGAPVLRFVKDPNGWRYGLLFTPVHGGSYIPISTQDQDQLNNLTKFSQENRARETKGEQLNYGNWCL